MADIFRGRIGRRFTICFVVVVSGVIGGTGWWSFSRIHALLERQLNDHLVAVAQLIAGRIDGDVVLGMKPNYGIYRRMQVQLTQIKGDVKAERVSVFDRAGKCLLSTGSESLVGKPYPRLAFDEAEVNRLWLGTASVSVRFQDERGVNFQTGYAPIFSNGQVVGAVGVEIGVGFVDALKDFGTGAIVLGVIVAVFTVIIGIVLGRSVTGPIDRLVSAAQEIGKGELAKPVVPPSRDELGYLGQTLDDMRQSILLRDEHLRTMLAGVAHEIRNPLGGIELHAGLIAQDLPENDPQRSHITRVIGEVHNLNQIISDFLAFARPVGAMPQAVRLADVVSDAAFLLAPEFDKGQIDYVQEVDSDLEVYVDPTQLKAVVVNLLKNACQAVAIAGKIWVVAHRDQRSVILSVKDNGEGISEMDQDRLFDPFYTTREKGSGLGLAIVKQAIMENGGAIDVESKPDGGATFILQLPQRAKGVSE